MLLQSSDRIELFDQAGEQVARLSRKAEAAWRPRLNAIREIRVLAMVRRTAAQEEDESHPQGCRVAAWEIPVVEVVSDQRENEAPG